MATTHGPMVMMRTPISGSSFHPGDKVRTDPCRAFGQALRGEPLDDELVIPPGSIAWNELHGEHPDPIDGG